ncbi:MAG: sulfate ABC transporter permease subunit CysT [Peptococcaceae bacterium]|jgi:sulfate transport system permease protein|nr:sulfate ABC transporter permease subunit CysT [Peptococcaceae bacterium]
MGISRNTRLRRHKSNNSVIPGFTLSLGVTLTMLSLIVMIPLASVAVVMTGYSLAEFWATLTDKMALHAYWVSLSCALTAAIINVVFGIMLAWVLVRYDFPGRRLLDGLIELPFALPTAVAGIALTTLYSDQGWIGSLFAPYGIKISYTTTGITLALVFIGIPFVVRSVQPVLEKLDRQTEEAAAILGASPFTTFRRVILPELLPAILTGFGLVLARGIGEYGSVVFIAGNIPYETQIAPLLIMVKLEQFNYAGATSIALVLIVLSFVILFTIHRLAGQIERRIKGGADT